MSNKEERCVDDLIVRRAHNMKVFADGEPTFLWGDWKAWQAACEAEGRTIPPAEFKALPMNTKLSYRGKTGGT